MRYKFRLLRLLVTQKNLRVAADRAADHMLVASCLKGDEEAWVELWTRYGPVVKAVARRAGCDPEEAKDVLQRVALAALQGLDRLREPEKLAGWLASTARFQAFEVVRKRRPGEQLFPGSAVYEPNPEESLQRDRDVFVLRRALLGLDERCRRLIQSLDLEDPPASYRKVAEAEGLAPSSIGPIRRRCLKRLRKILEKLSFLKPRAHIQSEG
jgi:RNA polymerase sigma factor (sigma-70 family)